ncbi:MAG: 6-phosphogluconolactonase [Ilumatobacter sp.]|nr:6-phosphogluconolactonase [Ilumatobacter sp.]
MDIRVGAHAEQRAATFIADRLRDAHRRRGEAFVALSGGSTAPPMIAELLDQDVPWETTIVWQVDERVAPDGDRARNANQLSVLPCQVRLMPVTAADLEASARQYGALLPERFDVVHLGLGDDGHTASWPPGDPGPVESHRSVEVVAEFHGLPRMTLTLLVVNAARSRAVLTVGAEKRPMVERWFLGDESLPITRVTSDDTFVFLDEQAAPKGIRLSE